jgi:phosphate transport system protein
MPDKHLSSRFDADLDLRSTRLLETGGMVESQVERVLRLMDAYDSALVLQVLDGEQQLNAMELELDEEISNVIARRQPAARDLRLLMAASKCVTNLERAGDEARKVAKRLRRVHGNDETQTINTTELRRSGELALMILRRALDAFARMDAVAAAQIVRDDEAVDNSFRAFGRRLVMQMTEAPRTIPVGPEYMFIGKAIERIGDHATNIAEFVVYVVMGRDVRHVPLDRLDEEVLAN